MDFGPRVLSRFARLANLMLVLPLLLTALVEPAAATTRSARPITAADSSSPCGTVAHTTYRHVVWILLENEGEAVPGSPEAPYLNGLSAQCGITTNYFAISHPSLPNYLALTSGSTHGVTDDGEPSEHPTPGPSIFSELRGNWRALEESMPTDCNHVTSGTYAARHNPAVYYTSLASACATDDVPLSYPLNLSAAFTFITPNICDDMHSCPISTGDVWLSRVVPLITSSAPYRDHSLALFITFDENDAGALNDVPTYAVAPTVPRGTRASTRFDHYSLLRTTEILLGLPLLGGAQDADSMSAAFHL